MTLVPRHSPDGEFKKLHMESVSRHSSDGVPGIRQMKFQAFDR